MRHLPVLALAAATIVLQGCSMSLFGSEKPKPAPALASAAAPAPAADTSAQAPEDEFALSTFDSNKDGVLAKDELEAGLKAIFAKADTSGDGVLSASEIRPINDKLLAVQGNSPVIDWNADGKIDMTEFASQWRTKFERADVNGDGTLDEKEMAGRAKVRTPRPLPQPELGKYRGKTS